MTRLIVLPLMGALALTAACEAKIGKDKDDLNANANFSATGKAEDGTVSIKAPGVDIKVNIPDTVRDHTNIGGNNDIVYPGSSVGGVHIEAGGKGGNDGAVEIKFSNTDAADKIAAWYRDPARKDFKIDSETKEGSGFVFNGHETDDNGQFKLRLVPNGKGGTDGTLSIQDRG